jgi:hypothetical protein
VVVEPESVEPESVEPEAVEPESVEPESVEPESVEPESVEPESLVDSSPELSLIQAVVTASIALRAAIRRSRMERGCLGRCSTVSGVSGCMLISFRFSGS